MRVVAQIVAWAAWLRRPTPLAVWTTFGLLLTSATGVYIYAGYVEAFYPIRDWLAWPLLKIWGYVALANLSWFAVGNLIVGRLLRLRDLPLLESGVVSTTIGVVVFTELMYLAGAIGLYGPVFALCLPLLLVAAGLPELRVWLGRYRGARASAAPLGTHELWLWGIGGALTFLLYLGVLSPDAVNYDASWCHLTIAQDYAREGGIVAFPGDWVKNVPHLASIVHTWGFSVPGLSQPALRWMLALHQEFGLFLWTLAGVAAAIRRMTNDETLRGSWVALFLFPIIFVYDNNLGGAADHVAAFFILPGVLTASRLLEHSTWQNAAAMVLCMAGGLLTKYQALYWIFPLLLLVALKLVRGLIRELRKPSEPEQKRVLLRVALAVGLGLPLLVLPHFLKNWIFYRNPVYPFMQQVFSGSRPVVENGVFLITHQFTDLNWVPKGGPLDKVKHALSLMFTFSFEPHYSFTKSFPVFGSLFTLLLPALLFIRQRRDKLLWVFVGLTTLFIWGLTFNVDRNLQVFMPILVATTGGILVEVWRLGWLARLAVAPLVAFQVLWGADAFFYSNQDRVRSALDLIGTGFAGSAKHRFDRYRSAYVATGKALPPDARVLLHTSHISLGIDRELVLDWAGFQGLISYSRIHTARELFELYRRLGITHLIIPGERPSASIQEEIVFQSLVARLTPNSSSAGGLRVVRLGKQAPAAERPYRVLTIGLYGYGTGIFPIDQLHTNEFINPAVRRYARPSIPAPSSAEDLEAFGIDAIVVGVGANPSSGQKEFLRRHFSSVAQYPAQQTIYLKKRPGSARD
ncbi:MAG TPA: hypothetical protein VJN18_20675 [Polyangiaceae bacterium]|nr:hypothetical protein [Polyangiaceae bacterium]